MKTEEDTFNKIRRVPLLMMLNTLSIDNSILTNPIKSSFLVEIKELFRTPRYTEIIESQNWSVEDFFIEFCSHCRMKFNRKELRFFYNKVKKEKPFYMYIENKRVVSVHNQDIIFTDREPPSGATKQYLTFREYVLTMYEQC